MQDRIYTDEEVRSACVRYHLRRRGERVPRRWRGVGPEVYQKWEILTENRRYEIDPEGNVRVRHGERNGGHVLKRFRKNGSLCVEVWRGTKHTTLRVWYLMEKYWPKYTYPQNWKPQEKKIVVDKEDGRRKLTLEERKEIADSPMSASQIARTGKYPVGRRHISRIKNGA